MDMTIRVRAKAPAKAILFGEHYVVYGAPGLVAAIGPDNEVELEAEPCEKGGASFAYVSTRKENNVQVRLADGAAPAHPYAALYRKLAGEWPALGKLRVRARVTRAWPLKGVGNSASLGAALGAGLRALAGEKSLAPSIIFEDAQTCDEVAHGGGRPSGIDAAAAAYGGLMEFEKDFTHPLKPKIKPCEMAKMEEVEFLLVDTFTAGTERGSTGALVAGFARAHGIEKKPGELGAHEREAVYAGYLPLFLHAKRALEAGEWNVLGRLMDENHRMLKYKGVSSPGIEKAVAVCKSFGALGAKLSGAGGEGGVVIALAEKRGGGKIKEALALEGFGTYPFQIAQKGAQAKKE